MSTDQYFTPDPHSAPNWRSLDVVLAGHELELVTANGIFAADKLDRGTSALLETVPDPPATGTFLDIGCGWGPISITLALSAPAATVWAVDVNGRALEATRRNAAIAGCANVQVAEPGRVPAGLDFDLIWANPPIRIGKDAAHQLLMAWLPRLAAGGEAWLVVAKQLGADSLLSWLQTQLPEMTAERIATTKGFRVIRVINPAQTKPRH